MVIFKYKVFNNSDEFETFQKEQNIHLHQIQPLIKSIETLSHNNSDNVDLSGTVALVVIYCEKVD